MLHTPTSGLVSYNRLCKQSISVSRIAGPSQTGCVLLQYKRVATEQDQSTKSQDIKKGGLDALLGSLQQAKKVNVLDKSRMDWGDFKSSDVKVH